MPIFILQNSDISKLKYSNISELNKKRLKYSKKTKQMNENEFLI